VNHSTLIDECRDHRSIQAKTIRRLQQLSQLYMNAAIRYNHPSTTHMCIVSSDRAIEHLLKALYMKQNGCTVPPAFFSLHDIIRQPAQEPVLDLNMVTLVYNIHFLAGCNDLTLLEPIHPSYLARLLTGVDAILLSLSARISS